MPRVIGVDYSSSVAYIVCVENAKVARSISLHSGDSLAERLRFFRQLNITFQALYKEEQATKEIYIEEAWVNGRFFPKSGLMLSRMATYLELAAVQSYFQPIFVHPNTWRSLVLGTSRFPNRDAKDRAIEWVEENLGWEVPVMGSTGRGKTKDHNFAEAACIAAYGSRQYD